MRAPGICTILVVTVIFGTLMTGCRMNTEEIRTFYKVPLVCGADPAIACGSRVKPLFLETEKQSEIKESWINRTGTVIAFVWKENISAEEKKAIVEPLFKSHDINAEPITDEMTKARVTESFFSNHVPTQKGKDKWYKGMEVDQLSLEEAECLGDTATLFAVKAALINETEALKIKSEIIAYMKAELVKVRTYKELTSEETDLKWKKQGFETYVKHIGSDRAEKIRDYYIEYQKKLIKEKSCCKKDDGSDSSKLTSEITCPKCGHKKIETMPEDVCQLKYTCEKCKTVMLAKEGDCCVFCSYGDHKCPSMQ